VNGLTKEWKSLVDALRRRAIQSFREALAREILVGPHCDESAIPRGHGFSIFIGEWRIGWWSTRGEACGVAETFVDALKGHPVELRDDTP
jgi:hypothetical protein